MAPILGDAGDAGLPACTYPGSNCKPLPMACDGSPSCGCVDFYPDYCACGLADSGSGILLVCNFP